MMIFDMSCALEIPEATLEGLRLSLVCFVSFRFVLFFCFARGLAKGKCGGI